MRHLAFSLFILGAVPGVVGAQNTIRDQVLTNGVSEELVIADYPTVSLRALTATAGAVVRVTVRSSDTFLSSDGMAILTDYRLAVVDVMKGSPQVTAGDVITARRVGGVMNIEGRRVISSESGFPAFAHGGEYVLFLRTESGQPYQMAAGPQSAFRIDRGMVTPIASARESSPILLLRFMDDVKELLQADPVRHAGEGGEGTSR